MPVDPSLLLDCKSKCGASEYVEDVANLNWCKIEQRLQALESPLVYDNETRPDYSTLALGTMIFNTDDNAPNWVGAASWVDSSGNPT